MNEAYKQYCQASLAMGQLRSRKEMRDLLRAEPELRTVRKGVFGAWWNR